MGGGSPAGRQRSRGAGTGLAARDPSPRYRGGMRPARRLLAASVLETGVRRRSCGTCRRDAPLHELCLGRGLVVAELEQAEGEALGMSAEPSAELDRRPELLEEAHVLGLEGLREAAEVPPRERGQAAADGEHRSLPPRHLEVDAALDG